jgi:hypothetical protein
MLDTIAVPVRCFQGQLLMMTWLNPHGLFHVSQALSGCEARSEPIIILIYSSGNVAGLSSSQQRR